MLTFCSLAIADFIIGAYSIPFFTMTLVTENQKWPLRCFSHYFKSWLDIFFSSRELCDIWLSIDYMASNASVMNLLAISVDRWRWRDFMSYKLCNKLLLVPMIISPACQCPCFSFCHFQDHLPRPWWWGWGSLTFTFILSVFAKCVKSQNRDKLTK